MKTKICIIVLFCISLIFIILSMFIDRATTPVKSLPISVSQHFLSVPSGI